MNNRSFKYSGVLISDYDFVPEGLSEGQIEQCEYCRYRVIMVKIDVEKARKNGRYVSKTRFGVGFPACNKERCLIDNENIEKIINSKRTINGGR